MLMKRLFAFVLDLYVITAFALVLILALHIWQTVVVIGALLLFICRDVGHVSIGRRIFKLSVVQESDHSSLPLLRRIGRNVTYLVWPLEVIAFLKCNGRRLGDMWMKSEVIIRQ